MTRKLIMLRHGQTEYNASGRMQGQMDTKLSDVGIRQAEAVARYMKGVNIGYVVSSDLSRAAETARIVASSRGLPVHLDSRLRETNLGDWQGQSREDVDRDYPGARAQWRHNALWDDGAVLLVAHGGTIGSLTSDLLELSIEQHHMFTGLKNTNWARLTARPRYSEEPNANGEGDPPVVPQLRFTPDTLGDAQWYLDGWNMSVAPGLEAG